MKLDYRILKSCLDIWNARSLAIRTLVIRESEAISDDLTLASSLLLEALQVHRISLPFESWNPNMTDCKEFAHHTARTS